MQKRDWRMSFYWKIFQYRITLQSTTGASPPELLMGTDLTAQECPSNPKVPPPETSNSSPNNCTCHCYNWDITSNDLTFCNQRRFHYFSIPSETMKTLIDYASLKGRRCNIVNSGDRTLAPSELTWILAVDRHIILHCWTCMRPTLWRRTSSLCSKVS